MSSLPGGHQPHPFADASHRAGLSMHGATLPHLLEVLPPGRGKHHVVVEEGAPGRARLLHMTELELALSQHGVRVQAPVAEPYTTWARNQADAAILNLLSALPVRWNNNPHYDRIAAHKPQQLIAAARARLRVPRSIITNNPVRARSFAKGVNGPLICKPVLGGRLNTGAERQLMVATHRVDPADFDDDIRLTAHYFQEDVPKKYEVRLVYVDGRMFAGTLLGTSDKARTDWRTDYDHIEYGTTEVPSDIAVAVRRFIAPYGIVFGSFDFAVTPDDDWVFFENNPAGTWSWVENRTGLPIAAAHADYLQGNTA